MPKPVSVPTWATDATYTNGGVGVAGTDTKVAPSSGVQAEGHVPGTPASPQRVNWWKNAAGVWLAYVNSWFDSGDELVYPVTKTRTRIFAHSDILLGVNADGTGNPDWDVQTGGVNGPILVPRVGGGGGSGIRSYAAIHLRLPHGATITTVRVWFQKHSALGSGDRWAARFESMVNWDFTSPASSPGRTIIGASTEDDGTTGLEVIQWTGLSTVVDNTDTTYYVVVDGPTTVGASNRLYGAEVTFEDPGPRNF